MHRSLGHRLVNLVVLPQKVGGREQGVRVEVRISEHLAGIEVPGGGPGFGVGKAFALERGQ